MKLDVSDLFDRLYDVWILAKHSFKLSEQSHVLDDDVIFQAIDEGMQKLSDGFFLPACQRRLYYYTQFELSLEEIKSRLICETTDSDGLIKYYGRYAHPEFYSGPFFAVHTKEGDKGRSYTCCYRPLHKLKVWTGSLPPWKIEMEPPLYSPALKEDREYYYLQETTHHDGPVTYFYEYHGEGCLRLVYVNGWTSWRKEYDGKWLRKGPFKKTDRLNFEKAWKAAEPDNS
ncbi:MAG: hypothetical protein R3C11_13600 [Planctomycetaceae bacterium]